MEHRSEPDLEGREPVSMNIGRSKPDATRLTLCSPSLSAFHSAADFRKAASQVLSSRFGYGVVWACNLRDEHRGQASEREESEARLRRRTKGRRRDGTYFGALRAKGAIMSAALLMNLGEEPEMSDEGRRRPVSAWHMRLFLTTLQARFRPPLGSVVASLVLRPRPVEVSSCTPSMGKSEEEEGMSVRKRRQREANGLLTLSRRSPSASRLEAARND